ncbi:hypothetical protein MLD38_017150 [Melastoma candidum]|uniref:Uncharacterized protein n=1 Tax=Melastoma candidum TaxID=119954 RepID=A0ACB9QPW0_9MYRT|nr:hypothetical protein MLD38_017150 [Melastoma candidum]
MDSDYHQPYNQLFNGNQQQQQPQSQMGSGLTRFRSAPSSFFSNLLDRDFCEEFLNRPSSPETERILVKFISGQDGGSLLPHRGGELEMKPEARDFSLPQQLHGQGQGQGCYQRQGSSSQQQEQQLAVSRDSGFGGTSRFGMDRFGQAKPGPSLTRHSSSPAGLFADINIDESGFVSVDNMRGEYGGSRLGSNHRLSYSSLRTQPHLPPPSSSSLGHHMSPIAEEKAFVRDNQESDFGSWEDAVSVSENLSVFDQNPEIKASDTTHNEAVRSRPPSGLSHHLSLPKTTMDMSAIDKFLQMQDSVPCKIRAKRGFATHPRSIAERVRRTKISERMRKLQDLVPNMDKQTNTADMLDLAVDYVKELQKQVKALASQRARCTCSNGQQQHHHLQSN